MNISEIADRPLTLTIEPRLLDTIFKATSREALSSRLVFPQLVQKEVVKRFRDGESSVCTDVFFAINFPISSEPQYNCCMQFSVQVSFEALGHKFNVHIIEDTIQLANVYLTVPQSDKLYYTKIKGSNLHIAEYIKQNNEYINLWSYIDRNKLLTDIDTQLKLVQYLLLQR